VINGCERGGSTTEIRKAVKADMLEHLQKDYHVFLDNLTGDIFGY
jgi:transposase